MSAPNHSPWLLPREHGAWGIVLVPFLTAVGVAGSFRLAVWTALAAVLLAYIARYPVELLLLPGLYKRAGSPPHGQVRRAAWAYGALAAVVGILLVTVWRLYLLLVIGLAAAFLFLLHIWLSRRESDRSWTAELLGTTGLTLSGLVGWIAATGGLNRVGLVVWGLNAVYFCSGIVYVKSRIRAHQTRHHADAHRIPRFMVAFHLGVVVLVAVLVFFRTVPPIILIPFLVATARAAWGARRVGQPFALKQLGWSEVALSIFFGLFVILGFRW